jgi:tellurite resistance protein
MIDTHAALIYAMVLVSAADRDMTDAEMRKIGEIVRYLPAFRGFDQEALPRVASECAALLGGEDGLDRALAEVKAAVPMKLRETAYAMACEVATADERDTPEKERMLDILEDLLGIDALVAAAIERSAWARHMRL